MTNPWVRRTRIFIIVVVLAVGVYDLIASEFGGYEATISRRVPDLPPAFIFGLGFAFGHMLWIQRIRQKEE